MAETVKGSISGADGEKDIRLDNAASEATLLKLLQAVQKSGGSVSNTANLASAAGINPSTVAAATQATTAGTASTKMAATAATSFASKIGQTASVLGEFAGTAFAAFEAEILLAVEAFRLVRKVQLENFETLRETANAGATFGGALTQVRLAAANAYLDLKEFGSVVKNNADVFSSMGGSAQDGVNQFVKIQNKLLAPGSETANNLASLGISMADAADLTASYMRAQGSMNKDGLKNTAEVSKAVTAYAQELTLLSEISGKSRDEIKKQMDKETMESQWKNLMAHLSPEEARKAQMGLAQASLQGQGAIDYFKAKMMGFPPLTEQGQQFAATQRAGTQALDDYARRAKDASISADEAAKLNRSSLAKAISQGAGDMDKMRTVLQASGLSGSALSKTLAEAQNLQTQFMKNGKMMSESEIKASLEKMDADTKRQESEAAQLQKNEAEMKKFYATLLTAITPIISGLTTVLSTLTSVASFLITPFVKLAGWIIDIGADINSFFGKIYATTAGSLIKSFQELKEKFLKAVDPILAPITKLFSTGSGIFGKYFDVIAKVTSTLLSLPLTLVFKGLGLLVDALSITFELIGGAVEVVLDPLQSFADFLSDGLDALGSFVDYIASWDWIPESSETLKNSFDSVAYFVKDIVSSSFNFLKSAVGDVAEAFRSVGSVIKDVVMVPFNLLGSVINGISNTFKFFGELLSEITDPMKTLADTIASMISSVSSIGSGISSALSSINPSNWFGGGNKTPKLENEGTSGSPKTPKMADGGIVSKATNVIAGEAGPEAIVPLSQMGTIIQNFKMPEIISNTLNAAKSSDSKTQSDESNGAALEVITGSLDQLNNSIQEMLSYMRNIADNTENTHKATKSLNGNLWA